MVINMLLKMSITGTLLIIFVVLVRSVFYNKVSKRIFQYLWGIAIAGAILPISINFLSEYMAKKPTIVINSQLFVENPSIPERTVMMTTNQAPNVINVKAFLVLYLVCLSLLVMYTVFKFWKSKRIVNQAIPILENDVINNIKKNLDCENVKFYESDRIYSPMLYGIVKPRILLPKNFDIEDREVCECILLHEMFHIKNKDLIKKQVALIVLLVHFFNPFVWLMYILFNRDIESSCDERVINYLGLNRKKDYALCLVSYVEKNGYDFVFSQHFAKNALEERIVSIMKAPKKYRKTFALLLAGLGCLMFISIKTIDIEATAFTFGNLDAFEYRVNSDKFDLNDIGVTPIPFKKDEVWTKEELEVYLGGDYDDNDLILPMAGGFMVSKRSTKWSGNFGYCGVGYNPETGVTDVTNIATDINTRTIGEMKQIMLGESKGY